MLVDANTGAPTSLTGDQLKCARRTKAVITKGAYARRQFRQTRKRE